MSTIARMIDANANRAREALRVMEDAARFALNDASLSAEFKAIRHELRAALDLLPPGWLDASRDVAGDVGRSVSTESEMSRANLGEVVVAAGKRLTEALRVIEEIAKIVDEEVARRVEALRYRAYEVEHRLTRRLGSGSARQWKLCLLLTISLCRRPWREVLSAALAGGADCVQVREKEMEDHALADHVREVISKARPSGASVIVNDRVDLALACNADGVHVGQGDLPMADVRRIAGRQLIVGVSTHDLHEAGQAVEDGADYCGVGAMFESYTKARNVSSPSYLHAFIANHPRMPHLAIGGITTGNVHEVIEAGARGFAVSRAICAADDPRGAAERLLEAIEAQTSALPFEAGA